MPGISGLELLEQLSRDDVRLPAIVMSAYGDVPMVVRAMKAGALNFLEKPCRDQQLWEAIQEGLRWDAAHRQHVVLRTKVRPPPATSHPRRTRGSAAADRRQVEQDHRRRVGSERANDRGPPGQADEEDEGRIAGGIDTTDPCGRPPLRKTTGHRRHFPINRLANPAIVWYTTDDVRSSIRRPWSFVRDQWLGASHEPSASQNPLDAMEAETSCLSAPPGQLNCRILLVEDDQDHQPLLSLMLRKAGSEVTVAENGQVAVDLARAARDAGMPFDMIVMDVQMPVLDGLAATRELRAAGFTQPDYRLDGQGRVDRPRPMFRGRLRRLSLEARHSHRLGATVGRPSETFSGCAQHRSRSDRGSTEAASQCMLAHLTR